MRIFTHTSLVASRITILFVVFCMLLPLGSHAAIRYVASTAAGLADGSSWTNASADLQAMINASASGDEVWVKAGTYKPTQDPFGSSSPSDPRDKTFYVKDGVKLYGGFAGTETATTQRNIAANATILSGDIGSVGSNTDNCYHVVLASAPNTGGIGVTLDGFTFTDGRADVGNLYVPNSSISVVGNTIDRFRGGGIYIFGGVNNL